jgi:hypothetical protein
VCVWVRGGRHNANDGAQTAAVRALFRLRQFVKEIAVEKEQRIPVHCVVSSWPAVALDATKSRATKCQTSRTPASQLQPSESLAAKQVKYNARRKTASSLPELSRRLAVKQFKCQRTHQIVESVDLLLRRLHIVRGKEPHGVGQVLLKLTNGLELSVKLCSQRWSVGDSARCFHGSLVVSAKNV